MVRVRLPLCRTSWKPACSSSSAAARRFRKAALVSEPDLPLEITVSDERIEPTLTALALVSAGIFEAARERLSEIREDRFGMLEEALRIFMGELEKAQLESRD